MLIDGVLSDGVASDGACWLWLCDMGRAGKGRIWSGEGGGLKGRRRAGNGNQSITAWARGKGGRKGKGRAEREGGGRKKASRRKVKIPKEAGKGRADYRHVR